VTRSGGCSAHRAADAKTTIDHAAIRTTLIQRAPKILNRYKHLTTNLIVSFFAAFSHER